MGATINSNHNVNASEVTSQEKNVFQRLFFDDGPLYNDTGNPDYLETAKQDFFRFKAYGNMPSTYGPLANYIKELQWNNLYSEQHGYVASPTISQPMLSANAMRMLNYNNSYDNNSGSKTAKSQLYVNRKHHFVRAPRHHARPKVRRRVYRKVRRPRRIRRVIRRRRSAWFKGVPLTLQGNYTSYAYNRGKFGMDYVTYT